MNFTRSKKAELAMKTAKSVMDITVEAFEDVRAAFLPRPKGRNSKKPLRRQTVLLWDPPQPRQFDLHLMLAIPI